MIVDDIRIFYTLFLRNNVRKESMQTTLFSHYERDSRFYPI